MKKLSKKILTVFLATLMMLALAAPALAEDAEVYDQQEASSENASLIGEGDLINDADIVTALDDETMLFADDSAFPDNAGDDSVIFDNILDDGLPTATEGLSEEIISEEADLDNADLSEEADLDEISLLEEEDIKSGDWVYSIIEEVDERGNTSEHLYIVAYTGTQKSITVPDTIDGKEVYGVGRKPEATPDKAWNVSEITISKGIQAVGLEGFGFNGTLKKVTFAEGSEIKNLDNASFYACGKLETVVLPEGLVYIGNSCFGQDTSLKSINIPSTVYTIGNEAFSQCTSLAAVTGGEGLINIMQMAFANTAIKTFPYGPEIKFISATAFQDCAKYDGNYPSGMKKIEDLDGDGVKDYYMSDGTVQISGTDNYYNAYRVLEIINDERTAEGKAKLTMDKELLEAAMQRAAELSVRFAHYRPNGEMCYTASSKISAENIAMGQSDPARVMASWMGSAGHKNNILNSDFKSVGIGCFVNNDETYWVQVFGKSNTSTEVKEPANADKTRDVEIVGGYYIPEAVMIDEQFRTSAGVSAGTTLNMAVNIRTPETVLGYEVGVWGKPDNSSFEWDSTNASVATVDKNGKVTAKKPGVATITAQFGQSEFAASYRLIVHYSDVTSSSKYYYKPVYWAAERGITAGYMKAEDKKTGLYGKFGYDLNCLREHVVTFLWRLEGKPEPKTTVSPFSDVQDSSKYYYKAVLWAAENGITKGYSDGTFRPEATCLREHVVTFLWRYAGAPVPQNTTNPFNDLKKSSYFYQATLWAAENGITKGYSTGPRAGGFGADLECLREHVVTFLYRFNGLN